MGSLEIKGECGLKKGGRVGGLTFQLIKGT